ncbi:MAG: electron transporter SenC [Verrucomicrobia bacterium]|nr:MAG: electron transporter SenC [Verrucomicrobiota bacterium]
MGSGLLFGLSACRPVDPSAAAPVSAGPTDEKTRHALTGTVVSVLTERGTLLVDHDEISGYMPRMTMEFHVGGGDLSLAQVGARLRATLVEEAEGKFSLEGIWWGDDVSEATVRSAAAGLREDTNIRGRGAYREVGENLPDFALYNQNGEVVAAAKWRGKQILMNFIFSRCPVATMCPAATAKMIETQALAKEAGVANLELVSITLDPEYDTPGVLREYAEVRGIDTSNFSFLTGPEGAIKDLFRQFGILTEMKGGVLNHTLATLLINPDGKIVWRADGSGWSPAEFVKRMKR